MSSDIRASLAAGGLSAETQTQIMELHSRNSDLSDEVKDLNAKLSRAKMVSSTKRLTAPADMRLVHQGPRFAFPSRTSRSGESVRQEG